MKSAQEQSETSITMLDTCMAWFVDAVETEMKRFDPETGRFMDKTGWGIVNQDVMLSLAYLYLNGHPDNPLYRQERLLRMIEQAGDMLRGFQYPDGKVEFVKSDGSRWGPIYMPWTMYHWLETYNCVQSELAEDRKAAWAEGLKLAYEGIHREMLELLNDYDARSKQSPVSLETIVHNIPVWNAMALHRASQVFAQPEWNEPAERMISMALEAQHPDGYWPEHHGPTTLYNTVYTHALGLYYYHGGPLNVKPALQRATRFHEIFTYPDGSLVETIDGRVKYHAHPQLMAIIGSSMFPEGRALGLRYVQLAIEQNQAWSSPRFAEVLRYWDHGADIGLAPTLFEQPELKLSHANALVVKQDDWYVCLSGFTSPAVENRWGQDRQSFIGIWHARDGLLIGGGNSKNQPEWSTFEVRKADGTISYIPHQGGVDETAQGVVLMYDGTLCKVDLISLVRGQLTLRFQAELEDGDEALVHIPLKLRPGLTYQADQDAPVELNDSLIQEKGGEGPHTLSFPGWQLQLEGSYTMSWPSYPFNPYVMDGKGMLDEAIGILTLPVEHRHAAREVTISIR